MFILQPSGSFEYVIHHSCPLELFPWLQIRQWLPGYMSILGLLEQRTANWVAESNRIRLAHSSGGWESKTQVSAEPGSLNALGESVPGLFWASGSDLQSLACRSSLQSQSPSSLVFPPRVSVSSHASLPFVFVSKFPSFYKGTSHIGLEPPLMPSSERHYICKDPLSK